MGNDWPDEWELSVVDGKVLDAQDNEYGTSDKDHIVFPNNAEGSPISLRIEDIQTIEADPSKALATVTMKDGEKGPYEYMGRPPKKDDTEPEKEGQEPAISKAWDGNPMMPSGDSVYDVRRMLEALGIPARCHIEALSGMARIDLTGLVDDAGLVQIGKGAVSPVRQLLAKHGGLMSDKVRVTEPGILEALNWFVSPSNRNAREVNDFLEAVGRPQPEESYQRRYDVLEACGGCVPGMDDKQMSHYLQSALRSYMLALVERQHRKTVVDMSLMLIGPQGLGKSNFARMLGGMFVMGEQVAWYRSTDIGFKDHKKLMESISGGVVAEMNEGKQMEDVKGIKSFFDKDFMQYRRSYRPDEETLPIRQVFIITHNEDRPILDDTGGRRFVPVWYREGGQLDPRTITLEQWRGLWRMAIADYEQLMNQHRGEPNYHPWREAFAEIEELLPELQRMASASAAYDDEIKEALKAIEPLLDSKRRIGVTAMHTALENELSSRLDYDLVGDARRRFQKHPEAFRYRKGGMRVEGQGSIKAYEKQGPIEL